MNVLERWFRRRAARRLPQAEADLPAALQAMYPGQTFAAHGYNWRVMHRRCEKGGRHPGVVIAPIGPTRRVLRGKRQFLRRLLRAERKGG
jgi:hypothetical protein